jgi:hypothetical protein
MVPEERVVPQSLRLRHPSLRGVWTADNNRSDSGARLRPVSGRRALCAMPGYLYDYLALDLVDPKP